MAKLSTDAEINSVRVKEGSAPSTPASGYGQIYEKTDGILYFKNDAGSEYDLTGTSSAIATDGWVAAGETWTYASADDPTYTFTVAGVDLTGKYTAGMRIRISQATGGTKYFIITKVAFSTDTTITIYGGTDYDLNNEAISSPYYSTVKAPQGFPLDPSKWTVEVSDTTIRSQGSPTQNVWYNLGSVTISIPIGVWRVIYEVMIAVNTSSAGNQAVYATLSTANNSESDVDFTTGKYINSTADTTDSSTVFREKGLNLSVKTSYYLNTKTSLTSINNIYNRNDLSKLFIRAICAYL